MTSALKKIERAHRKIFDMRGGRRSCAAAVSSRRVDAPLEGLLWDGSDDDGGDRLRSSILATRMC